MLTSPRAIVEVMAATANNRKNRDDHNSDNGILANISGRVTNTRVGPARAEGSASSPNDFIAGNIISPIINATIKSNIDTDVAVRESIVS